jgi:putative membrane protein
MDSSSHSRSPSRWVLIPVLLVATFVATAAGVSVYLNTVSSQPYGWWPGAPFGWFLFIPLFFIVFFALRFHWWGPWGGRGWYHQGGSAMDILRERFARGEVTREQFEQMKKDIQQ